MRNPNEVAILIYRRERYLLLRRMDPRYWHVAAGLVEPGESFLAAAERELAEATGLTASPMDLEIPVRRPIEGAARSEYDSGVTEVLVHTFAVEAADLWEPVLNEEHDIFRWSSFDDCIALLLWPEAREALRVLDARRKQPAGGA
ncbi:MAG: NUDIX domain-containing protein [Chloroflexota bacterium]|nr:NUDIX domain-containing protein [Chloroflexota bacterium]